MAWCYYYLLMHEKKSVLIHTGDQTGGHYFAFVRPTTEEKW
jgi:hypothetical protein